jgi:flagellar protein FliO/FliZ
MPSAAASFGQALFGLLVVLAVIGALAWVARRVSLPGGQRAALLKTVSGLSLGQRERVVVVEVADTWLVLGVTAQSINTLHTMPRGELPAQATAAQANPFAALLARARTPDEKR